MHLIKRSNKYIPAWIHVMWNTSFMNFQNEKQSHYVTRLTETSLVYDCNNIPKLQKYLYIILTEVRKETLHTFRLPQIVCVRAELRVVFQNTQ